MSIKKRWKEFKEEYNSGIPMAINHEFRCKPSQVVHDWNRTPVGNVSINGVDIHELVKKDKGLKDLPKATPLFANEQELRTFFKKHLVSQLPKEKQDEAVNYSLTLLHQGALLNPIGSAAQFHFLSSNISPPGANVVKDGIPSQQRQANFVVTPQGYDVQEKITQYRVYHLEEKNEEGEPLAIEPDIESSKQFLYKAEASIRVNYSKDATNPEISVIDNKLISGSNKSINAIIQKNFLERFIDAVKAAFNYNDKAVVSKNQQPIENTSIEIKPVEEESAEEQSETHFTFK